MNKTKEKKEEMQIKKELQAEIEAMLDSIPKLLDDKKRIKKINDAFNEQLKKLRKEIKGYPVNKLTEKILEKITDRENNLKKFQERTDVFLKRINEIAKIDVDFDSRLLEKKYYQLSKMYNEFVSSIHFFEKSITNLKDIYELIDILKDLTPKESQPIEVTTYFNYDQFKEKMESDVIELQCSLKEIENAFSKPEWKLIAERAGFIEKMDSMEKRIEDTHKFIRMGLIIMSIVFGLISSICLIFVTLLMSGILPK